jgi:Rrf2 family protein
MIKITKKIEYSLMVLRHMHSVKDGHLVSAREICEEHNLPFDPVAKVMQQLTSMGIIESIKGVKGGYKLKGDLRDFSYFDLAENLEGKSFTLSCMDGMCDREHMCNISTPMQKLNLYVSSVFKTITLEELVVDQMIAYGLTAEVHS